MIEFSFTKNSDNHTTTESHHLQTKYKKSNEKGELNKIDNFESLLKEEEYSPQV